MDAYDAERLEEIHRIVQDVADDPEIGEEVKRIAWAVCDLLAGAREELEARL
jgi:hypothetical protein